MFLAVKDLATPELTLAGVKAKMRRRERELG